jgi:hypothetical protein
MLGFINIKIFFPFQNALAQVVRNSSPLSYDHGHDSAILERELALFSFWQL